MDRDKLKAMLKHCEDYNSKYDGKPLDINKLDRLQKSRDFKN